MTALSPEALRRQIRRQLEGVTSWEDFLRTRLVLHPAELIDDRTREQLEALPGSLRLRGDAVPLDYEVEGGIGVARVRLREGQARRLRQDELPALDRPLRFAVQRGTHAPIQADTVADLQSALQRSPAPSNDDRGDQAEPRGRPGRGRRNGHARQRGGNPRGRNPRGRTSASAAPQLSASLLPVVLPVLQVHPAALRLHTGQLLRDVLRLNRVAPLRANGLLSR